MTIIILIIAVVIIIVLTIIIVAINNKMQGLQNEIKLLNTEVYNKSEELKKLAIIDPLTDIYNWHKLDSELQHELARIKRSHKPMGVVLIGVDSIKNINSENTTRLGDYVLTELSVLIKHNTRKIDIIGRWRGDKFLIIYSQTDKKTVLLLAEKLRIAIETLKLNVVGPVTASLGVTLSLEDDDEITVILRADKALLKAKKNGKNRVEFY
ncbi:MAG: GGDEF domain-containing protein [Spirochaetaceae bacterium]